MRPSYPDWTCPGSIRLQARVYSDSNSWHTASLPSKKPYYCLYMCKPTLPSQKASTCNTIEANQAEPRVDEDIIRYLRTALCPKSPSRHTRSGCKRPFHPDRGHLYKRSFTGPWPFAQWGMDIVGPLPAAAARKILLVATDYFSKWVEAEAYASIKDKDVTKFVWKNIICRFGIPQTIIATTVHSLIASLSEFLFGTKHPEFILHTALSSKQWQAEATNKTLITALKKRLEQAKGKWVRSYPASCGLIEPHPDADRKHSLRPRIRYGRSHSYRNRATHYPDEAGRG
ncbi:hypothetical protein CK203_030446 [Vitis vinifera]|uniref:Integrase catalytic domain-containing protein n=1 Tax=Vitis vinifera TaxID=29760 RepID=A0A438JDV9_VITVI|nr:hypothetical protein CK203_030446 [Vitis vinifera]